MNLYIELHVVVRDEDNKELPDYERRMVSMAVPEDWAHANVQAEADDIFQAASRIMGE